MSLPVQAAPARRPKLADRLVAAIGEEIRSGRRAPGTRLPTEKGLADAYAVSRTVVREAIARLAGDGLVEARQGAGVFVSVDGLVHAFAVPSHDQVATILNVLEVRMAVEIEAAALAAMRRTPSQDAAISSAFLAFEARLRAGEATGQADFDFHRAIAAATSNPFYAEILDVLGRRTIPRDVMADHVAEWLNAQRYQARLQAEHHEIMTAISAGDPHAAREAMRRHLSASQQRYRSLVQAGGDLARVFDLRIG